MPFLISFECAKKNIKQYSSKCVKYAIHNKSKWYINSLQQING